jgi:hypothetical protein
MIDPHSYKKGTEARLILLDIFKSMDKSKSAYCSTKFKEFCTTTNQLFKYNILGKEIISHLLLDDSVKKAEKYMKKEVSFLRNNMYRHLRNLKRKTHEKS